MSQAVHTVSVNPLPLNGILVQTGSKLSPHTPPLFFKVFPCSLVVKDINFLDSEQTL